MYGRTLTEDDWNVITWEEAVGGSKDAGYLGSKKFAEVCPRPIQAGSLNCDTDWKV